MKAVASLSKPGQTSKTSKLVIVWPLSQVYHADRKSTQLVCDASAWIAHTRSDANIVEQAIIISAPTFLHHQRHLLMVHCKSTSSPRRTSASSCHRMYLQKQVHLLSLWRLLYRPSKFLNSEAIRLCSCLAAVPSVCSARLYAACTELEKLLVSTSRHLEQNSRKVSQRMKYSYQSEDREALRPQRPLLK